MLAKRTRLELNPIHFDKSRDGRFNAPNAAYGVLYAARDRDGAFAETFLRMPGSTLIDLELLRRKAHVSLEVTSTLKLVRFAGPGLAVLGATAEVVHGGLPYDVAQAWSQALHAHPAGLQGVAYNARHDDEALCYALFDRAARHVSVTARATDLDQDWFWELAGRYGVGLSPG